MNVAVGERRVFRSVETRTMATSFALLWGVFGLVAFIVSEPWPTRAAISLACFAVAIAIWRRWGGQGIYATEDEVRVVGAFTSRTVAWSEIELFELKPSWRGMITWIELKDGSSIPAPALNAGSGVLPSMQRRARAQVDELNALLSWWQDRSP